MLDTNLDVRLDADERFTGALPRTDEARARLPAGFLRALCRDVPAVITDPLDRLLVAKVPDLEDECLKWYQATSKQERREPALLSIRGRRERGRLDRQIERHLEAVSKRLGPVRVAITVRVPGDEVEALKAAGRRGSFGVVVTQDLNAARDLLKQHRRAVVYMPDGPLQRHYLFDKLVEDAGYVVVRGDWKGSSNPGWGVVPVRSPSDAVREVVKALDTARTRWERGSLGVQ